VSGRHAPLKGPRVGALTGALCAAVLVSALAIAGWDLSGGRLMTMSTPSMCPTVCVGSLVAVRPLSGPVHPGELVTFHPPGQSQTFTHRVVKVEDNGSFTTKGDAESSPDPWTVAPDDVVGQVSFTVFGLGWWLRALPMVAIGTFLLLVVRRAYRLRNRRSFERLFGVLVVVVPLVMLHPLVAGHLIEVVPDKHHRGWLEGLFVNTGLLPSQLHVPGGGVLAHLSPSRLAWLHGPRVNASAMGVREWAALPAWGWTIVGALVLAPIVGFLGYRATRAVEPDSGGLSAAEAIKLGPFFPAPIVPRLEPADPAPLPAAVGPRHARADDDLAGIGAVRSDRWADPGGGWTRRGAEEARAAEASEADAPDASFVALATEQASASVAPAPAAPVVLADGPPEPEPEPEPGPEGAGSEDVTPPLARYSTLDRSLDEAPEPPPSHRAPPSGSAPRRNGGHRPRQVRGSGRASRRRSQKQELWSVHWPE